MLVIRMTIWHDGTALPAHIEEAIRSSKKTISACFSTCSNLIMDIQASKRTIFPKEERVFCELYYEVCTHNVEYIKPVCNARLFAGLEEIFGIGAVDLGIVKYEFYVPEVYRAAKIA